MTTQQLHYSLISLSLAVCVFMYGDAFLSPLKPHNEVVTGKWSSASAGAGYRKQRYYYIQTANNKYNATFSMFDNTSVGDTIQIFRSVITNSAQAVKVLNSPNNYSATIGFVKKLGLEFTLIDTLGLVVFLFWYRHIDYEGGKKNITWFLTVATAVLCYFHLTGAML